MAEVQISVTPYSGSLVAAKLLSGQQTLVLSGFGTPFTGTLSDRDGVIGTSDNGISTFNGQPITYIGSGTVQPGVNVLGATVPLGTAKQVMLFQVGGKIYFHYPDGAPNLLGAVALVTRITPAETDLFYPVCFVAGTRIACPDGLRPVEEIAPGDLVCDVDGAVHEVVWSGGQMLDLAGDPARRAPVLIPQNAFGPGRPARDLYVSQQHRLMLSDWRTELLFGEERLLVPAVALVGDRLRLDYSRSRIRYHHILCRSHVVLLAEGLPAESLLPGPVAREALGRASWDEAIRMLAALGGARPVAACPVLPARAATVLRPG